MSKIGSGFTIGSDFEFMFSKDGIPKSAIGILGGTKEEPISIGEGCFKQEDNVLLEYNIPPVNTFEDFNKYIQYCINYTHEEFPQFDHDYNSSHILENKDLLNPEALMFGCASSWNVHTGDLMLIERDVFDTLRSSAFHIHFGHKSLKREEGNDLIINMVKWFDILLGLPSILVDPDRSRRKLYGQAGEFRFAEKFDGFEARILGSYFLKNEELRKFVWDGICEVVNRRNQKVDSDPQVIEAINTYNEDLALDLMNKYNVKNIEIYA